MAYGRNGSHVDAVLLALLEFGVREMVIAHIHLQSGVTNLDVQLLFRNAQVGRRTLHVPHNAVRVGSTLDQQLPRTQQQIDPPPDRLAFQ